MTAPENMLEVLTEKNRTELEKYLANHEETAQFLINNLREYGPTLGLHHNSGNFKLVRHSGSVAAVFCLTRRGNLIVRSDNDFSEIILKACEDESVPLKGFIGDWKSVAPIWLRFKKDNPQFKPSYESKEILYSFALHGSDPRLKRDERVRFLELSDFDQWLNHNVAYLKDLGQSDDTTVEQKRTDFAGKVQERMWWGLFSGNTLLSRVALNAKGITIGQVGGVFTPGQYRQKGFAKATMLHMLKDCYNVHGHTKSVLFTGEADVPAQKLYESIGYERIGSFALILG